MNKTTQLIDTNGNKTEQIPQKDDSNKL